MEREEALSLLVERIAQLPLTAKKVLALYYHEELHTAEIATLLGLTKDEIEQIRAETLGLLQTALLVRHDLKLSRIAPSDSRHQTDLATCSKNDPLAIRLSCQLDRASAIGCYTASPLDNKKWRQYSLASAATLAVALDHEPAFGREWS